MRTSESTYGWGSVYRANSACQMWGLRSEVAHQRLSIVAHRGLDIARHRRVHYPAATETLAGVMRVEPEQGGVAVAVRLNIGRFSRAAASHQYRF